MRVDHVHRGAVARAVAAGRRVRGVAVADDESVVRRARLEGADPHAPADGGAARDGRLHDPVERAGLAQRAGRRVLPRLRRGLAPPVPVGVVARLAGDALGLEVRVVGLGFKGCPPDPGVCGGVAHELVSSGTGDVVVLGVLEAPDGVPPVVLAVVRPVEQRVGAAVLEAAPVVRFEVGRVDGFIILGLGRRRVPLVLLGARLQVELRGIHALLPVHVIQKRAGPLELQLQAAVTQCSHELELVESRAAVADGLVRARRVKTQTRVAGPP